MVLTIDTLRYENDQWLIEHPSGSTTNLERELDCSTVFIARGEWWHEVYCGKAVHFQGEIHGQPYADPVVEVKCAGKATGKVLAAPGIEPGKWAACDWYEPGECWPLAPGMQICTPLGTGDYVAGTYEKAPRGKCICTAIRSREGSSQNLGKIALDLANPPFPKAMWFYDQGVFREAELDFLWDPECINQTREFFGKLDPHALFWL